MRVLIVIGRIGCTEEGEEVEDDEEINTDELLIISFLLLLYIPIIIIRTKANYHTYIYLLLVYRELK